MVADQTKKSPMLLAINIESPAGEKSYKNPNVLEFRVHM